MTATDPGVRGGVDVRDMLVVHTALLREFRLLPAAVAAVPAGDRRRAATVDAHLGLVCDLLHHHHEGEDELLWPKLVERTGPEAHALIDRAEGQHEGLDAALSRVQDRRRAWQTDPGAPQRDDVAAAVGGLHRLLDEHLDLEERSLLPIAAAVLTPGEWGAIGDAAVAATSKKLLPLVFGMFAYEGDPEVLADMLSHAPAVPRLLLPRIAPRVYARRARAVYRTATP